MHYISPRPGAPSTFHTSYLTVYQVVRWIRDRDPEVLEGQWDFPIDDDDLRALQDKIADKAVAKSRSLDALLQLLAALETGRVKATGRLKWVGNPRLLPAHYWPHLTLANRTDRPDWTLPTKPQTCACFRTKSREDFLSEREWTEFQNSESRRNRDFWTDLRFDAKRVLTVWPPRPEEDDVTDERAQCHGLVGSVSGREPEMRPASDSIIHKTISEVYNDSDRRGLKPPNVKELVKPVQTILRDNGYQSSGRHIQELAQNGRHKSRRRKPGATVASEKRQQHR
jgi:hypothetical protein